MKNNFHYFSSSGLKGLFLGLILFLFVLPFSAKADFEGSGTIESPYLIKTEADLALLATYVNTIIPPYSLATAHYRLDNDINLSEYQNWIPIGTIAGNPFRGNFDGMGNTITGLQINNTALANAGLFGYMVAGASISNLGIVDAEIVSTPAVGTTYTGGIVGYNNAGIIKNCFFEGSITASANTIALVGGIAGDNNNTAGTVQRCYSMGTISGTATGTNATLHIGGITGRNNSASVLNSWTTTIITATDINIANIGGLVGSNSGTATVSNSAALNPSLFSTANTINIGRVVGNQAANATLSNNIAFRDMINLPNNAGWLNIGANLRDGTNISAAVIRLDGTLNGLFNNTNGWTTLNGKLPGFDAPVDLPGFLDGAPHISFVSVTPNFAGLTNGGTQIFVATVLGFNFTGEVVWSVEGGVEETTITADGGVLTVASDETAETLTVRATSTENNTISGTATVFITNFFTGKGTETEPFMIYTPEDLALFAQLVNDGNIFYNISHYKLGNDINLSDYGENFNEGAGWIPIGLWIGSQNQTVGVNRPFRGVFDGDGYKITNLEINNTTLVSVGLFGHIAVGSVIKNLNVVDAMVVSSMPVLLIALNVSEFFTGGIVGYNSGGKVENSSFVGSVTFTYPQTSANYQIYSFFTGGIVGDIRAAGAVTNCYSMGVVTSNILTTGSGIRSYTGGIAGRNNTGSISNSWTTSTISGTASANPNVSDIENATGGIVGLNTGATAIVSNSAAFNPSINNIISSGTRIIGRIVGGNSSNGTVSNNIAFNNMLNLPDGNPWGATGLDLINGQNITVTEINENDGTFGGRFTSQNGWTTDSGKLPGFGTSVELPEHLMGSTVINVVVEPDEIILNKGDTQIFTPTVFGFNIIGSVSWSVEGANAGTTINQDGELNVSDDETAMTFTVTATSTEDDTKFATAKITIFNGKGTDDDPYIIYTAEEMVHFAIKVNESNTVFNNKFYKLGNSIDLSDYGKDSDFNNGEGWIPIGNNVDIFPFRGGFDGDNNVITGLYINTIGNNPEAGLFGGINGAVIKNLGIVDVEITYGRASGTCCTGGLAGRASNSMITNVYVTGDIISHTATPYTGGIVGEIFATTITNSYAIVSVEANSNGTAYAGGIVGSISISSTISNCYSMGSVSATGLSGTSYSGGITGANSTAGSNVLYCWSTASISSFSNFTTYAGGISGVMQTNTSTIQNCVALNPIIYYRGNTIYVGRIVGRNTGSSPLISDNIALNNMIKIIGKEGSTNWESVGNTGLDGQNITAEAIRADGTLNNKFTTPIWATQNGKLPGFGEPIDLPNYLTTNPVVLLIMMFPEEVAVGYDKTQQFEATIWGYNLSQNVTWSVEGGITETTVSENGLLYVSEDETATIISVIATSIDDPTTSAVATVQVIDHFLGEGTEEMPYIIATAQDLATLADLVNSDNQAFNDRYYLLANNIDLSDLGDDFNDGNGWIPIGTRESISDNKPFKGVFDGNNNIIHGLYIENSVISHLGLFGYIENGTVKNLGIVDAEINSNTPTNSSYAGIVAGWIFTSNIINCFTIGEVTTNSTLGSIGGVVAYAQNGSSISDSHFIGSLMGNFSANSRHYVGGIIGYLNASSVLNSYVEGEVKANAIAGTLTCGGVVGMATSGVISKSYFSGSINSVSQATQYVGGIVGDHYYGLLSHCYSIGSIFSQGGGNSVGGIAGWNFGNLLNCWSAAAITGIRTGNGGSNIGGILGLNTPNGVISNCVALNPSFTNAGGAWEGRVVGQVAIGGGNPVNNYGYENMINIRGTTLWDNIGIDNIDGADIDIVTINRDATLGGLFTEEDDWINETGKLPGLFGKPVDMPLHLLLGETISVSGTVIDSDTNIGLENVEIKMYGGGSYIVFTDENGYFIIPEVYEGFTYTITASLLGYKIYSETIDIEIDGDDITYNIELNPIPVYTVSGKVTGNDTEGVGIPDVIITLSGYNDYTTNTDADGNYLISGVYDTFVYTFTVEYPRYLPFNETIEIDGENVVFDIALTEGIFPVGTVTATASEEFAHIKWDVPIPPIQRNYILDDGTADTGYRINPNAEVWLGNQFNVNEDGLLTSIDIYAMASSENTNREVILDIYDADRQLVGSSAPFVFDGNSWINAPLNNIPYAETFYAMVRWLATPGLTHFIGYDFTGPNAISGLNWMKSGDNWALIHEEITEAPPGVFMIRVNAYSFAYGGKMVSYGSNIDENNSYGSKGLENYSVYRFLEGQPENEWQKIAEVTEAECFDNEWNELPSGGYRYAVKAIYTTGASIARISNPLPKDWMVDFQVYITTNTGELPTGATVTLTNQNGSPDFIYTNTSGADGVLIENIFKGTYDLTISFAGFATYTVIGLEIRDVGLFHEAFIHEILYPAGIVTAVVVDNNVVVDWTEAGQLMTFRYDNGIASGQGGFGQQALPRGVIGSCHRINATLNSISWFLTDQDNEFPTPVNLWVIALNDQGNPSTQILFNENNVTSTKMEWNKFDFPEPVDAPNGFFIALSHPTGFLSIGTTTPNDDYPFLPMTHFYSGDFLQYDYIPLEEDIIANIMVRADGIIMGKQTTFGYPASKAITGYNIYRLTAGQAESDWTILATNLQSNTFTDILWSSQPNGEYYYAVKAVYSGGLFSPAMLSAAIFKDDIENIQSLDITANFSIYPNPVKDILHVVRSKDDNAIIEIYNSTGTLVQSFEIESKDVEINVSAFNSGIYLIRLISEHGSFVLRVVKE